MPNDNKLTISAHKTEGVNRTKTMRFYRSDSTGNAPRKGNRAPLNQINCSEERDEETGYGYFGARYMDHELMTMWLSVDPMADKYPSLSPYNYCMWNPVKLIDPDGTDVWEVTENGHVKHKDTTGGIQKQTVLYANGNTATFRGIKYHTIMLDLEDKEDESNDVNSSYGDENMQTAYANVFKSLADNTNVEWIMYRYSDDNYAL